MGLKVIRVTVTIVREIRADENLSDEKCLTVALDDAYRTLAGVRLSDAVTVEAKRTDA